MATQYVIEVWDNGMYFADLEDIDGEKLIVETRREAKDIIASFADESEDTEFRIRALIATPEQSLIVAE